MNRDSRLSLVLHGLLHLAAHGGSLTSEELAACMQTHPVVVRRTMAGLREAGFVRSAKGRGGGWSIACDPATVSLRDVHVALGEPALFALGHGDVSGCLVAEAVHAAIDDAVCEAEALLLDRFGSVSLAQLADDFARRLAARSHGHPT